MPNLRRGNRHLRWQTSTRSAHGWGPWCDPPLLHDGLGHRLRDRPEGMPLSLGAVCSLATCHRLGLDPEARAHACTTARLEAPPPLGRVEGLWRKWTVPRGAWQEEARGRLRPVQRNQHRGMRTALGLWPEGQGALRSWHVASQAAAASWGTVRGTLDTTGVTEPTTALIVRDGRQGLDKALAGHLDGVPHQRCLCHQIKNIADHFP